jgi:hypothetical protein
MPPTLPAAVYPAGVFDGNAQENAPEFPPNPTDPTQGDADDYNKIATEVVAMETDLIAAMTAQGQGSIEAVIADIQTQIDDTAVLIGQTTTSLYTNNLPSGTTEADLGLNSIDLQSFRGGFATGNIRFGSNPLDGETLTIGDGANTVVFEFDDGGGVTGGNTAVLIGVDNSATAVNFFAALAASVLTISETGLVSGNTWWRFVQNDTPGTVGNVTMADTSAAITTSGLSGGFDAWNQAADTVLIGNLSSAAFGADESVFIGSDITGTGFRSVNIGSRIFSVGDYTVVIGPTTWADGEDGIAIGSFCQTGLDGDIGLGNCVVDGPYAMALGQGNWAGGEAATAVGGENCSAGDDFATAVGSNSWAGGIAASAFGYDSSANHDSSTALGGFFDTIAVTQRAHIADPTDLPTAITAINALLLALEQYGLLAAV